MSRVVNNDARITDAGFLIYTTQFCSYCTAAKRLLTNKGLSFLEIELDREPHKLKTLFSETGHRTVPVIYDLRDEDVRFIGGFDQLLAEHN